MPPMGLSMREMDNVVFISLSIYTIKYHLSEYGLTIFL